MIGRKSQIFLLNKENIRFSELTRKGKKEVLERKKGRGVGACV